MRVRINAGALRLAMIKAGMTVNALSKASGVSVQTIRKALRYEEARVDLDTAIKLAEALGVDTITIVKS